MISVCMATYNGQKYIKEQITSILEQLGDNDELVISDDQSTDNTLDIIHSFHDERIKVFVKPEKVTTDFPLDSATHNFANALAHSKGDLIFLADQDDVWLPNHIKRMAEALKTYDWALSDCKIVDEQLNVVDESIFKIRGTKLNIPSNLWSACYQGCCMAFRREVLEKALPFPRTKVGHDLWLGLIANKYFKTTLIREPLLLYRRHGGAISPTGMHKKAFTLLGKIHYRMYIVGHLIKKMASEAMRGNF